MIVKPRPYLSISLGYTGVNRLKAHGQVSQMKKCKITQLNRNCLILRYSQFALVYSHYLFYKRNHKKQLQNILRAIAQLVCARYLT